MYKFELTNRQGEVVGIGLVDEQDRELAESRTWRIGCRGYVVSCRAATGTAYLHRLILGLPVGDPRQGDHINRNRLDNRRSNLRIVSDAQNKHNVPGRSGYRGVTYQARNGKRPWFVRVQRDGKSHYLGAYESELEAAKVAARWRAANLSHTIEDPALLV